MVICGDFTVAAADMVRAVLVGWLGVGCMGAGGSGE